MPDKKPLLLLDRDGTLITEQDYLSDPKKVRLLSGVGNALRRLSQAGYPMIIISNQSGVGRGLMTEHDVRRVNHKFMQILRSRGVKLAGIYYCIHHPADGCSCRKPKLGLVRQAAKDLGRSWKRSISVGDKWLDVELGQKTGGQGVLVLTGYGRHTLKEKKRRRPADYVARNFAAAARWILQSHERTTDYGQKNWTRNR